jgi:transposase-like protein
MEDRAMSDSPDGDEGPVACPACDSTNIGVRRGRELKYQCRDCGTEFDEDGAPKEEP